MTLQILAQKGAGAGNLQAMPEKTCTLIQQIVALGFRKCCPDELDHFFYGFPVYRNLLENFGDQGG